MNALRTNVPSKGRISLSDFAWFVVVYNIAVIIWGAYVHATGSRAGCLPIGVGTQPGLTRLANTWN
jgi:hypothetical protein